MGNKYILKQFIAFLKRNYVYREFLNLMMDDRNFRITYKADLSDPTDYISFMVLNQPKMLINNAFDWSNSTNITRGQWYDLHKEWCHLCTILMEKFHEK